MSRSKHRSPLQDSGGYTKSGELPAAEHVYVNSERELRHELDSILKELSPTAEWTARIQVKHNIFPDSAMCAGCLHVLYAETQQTLKLMDEGSLGIGEPKRMMKCELNQALKQAHANLLGILRLAATVLTGGLYFEDFLSF